MIPAWLRSWLLRSRFGRRHPLEAEDLGVDLEALGVADAFRVGARRSLFRGSGLEADGVRVYVPGDDTRTVDWRVTARTGRLHVRELVEERGTDVLLVLDQSASLLEGPSPAPRRAALTATAALARTAHRSGHRIGLVRSADRWERVLRPASRRDQLRRLLSDLTERVAPSRGGGLSLSLRTSNALLGARSLVVVVSDFRIPAGEWDMLAEALARLARRHDVLPVRIRVPGPEDLPPVGTVVIRPSGSSRPLVLDTSDPRRRAGLAAAAEEREGRWRSLVSALDLRPIDLDPFEAIVPQLHEALSVRRRGAV